MTANEYLERYEYFSAVLDRSRRSNAKAHLTFLIILAVGLVLGAILLVANPAYAGSITITVQSGSPAINATKTFTIPDADIQRFIAAQRAAYPVAVPAVTDPQTGAITTPATTRVPTVAEALTSWATGFMQGTVANVQSYEKQNAAQTATASVAPISAQ